MKETRIVTRKGVNGGYTAVWQGYPPMPIEAHLAVGKGDTREGAIRDLFKQVPNDVIRRELMPFQVVHSEEYHPC